LERIWLLYKIKIYKKMSDFFIDECPLPYHTM
jgi:hypothetical protein